MASRIRRLPATSTHEWANTALGCGFATGFIASVAVGGWIAVGVGFAAGCIPVIVLGAFDVAAS